MANDWRGYGTAPQPQPPPGTQPQGGVNPADAINSAGGALAKSAGNAMPGMAPPAPYQLDPATRASRNMAGLGFTGTPGAGSMPPPPPPAPVTPPPSNAPPGEGYGPGFGEIYGKGHIGQYDQPTMLEQFAQQQMNGNNPYYDRLRQQGEAALNQQMAARGHYNSGGALSALGNFDAGLYADQFANMGNLVGQASNIGLNRLNSGMGEASNIQGLTQQRLGQQFGEASDIAHLGAGLFGNFYNQGGALSGDAAMAGVNAGANAAGLDAQGQGARQNFIWDAAKGAFVPK